MYTYKTERFVFNKLVNDQLTHGAVGGLTTCDILMKLLFKISLYWDLTAVEPHRNWLKIGKLIGETCGQD